MPLTKTKDILDATQDWINWGKQFGWACYGCDDRDSGSFHRGIELRRIPFTITRAVRDDIDRVINSQHKRPGDAGMERVRCANLADAEYGEQAKLAAYHKGEGDFKAMDRRNAAAVSATKIAAAIRNPLNT